MNRIKLAELHRRANLPRCILPTVNQYRELLAMADRYAQLMEAYAAGGHSAAYLALDVIYRDWLTEADGRQWIAPRMPRLPDLSQGARP